VHLTVALHAFRGADVQMHEDPRFYQDLDTKIKNSSEINEYIGKKVCKLRMQIKLRILNVVI